MNEPFAPSLKGSPEGELPALTPSVIDALCRRVLFVAITNIGATSPNPSVGAVVADARTGEVIASAATARGGRPHAEVLALREAGERANGALMITTLEPCSHFGATPPCAHSIVDAGVSHVIYGSLDPDTRVAGRGLAWLAQHGVTATRGEAAFVRHCDWLNLGHGLRVTERRPFVQVKLAVDAGGLVPRGNGKPVFVTGETARAAAHLLRASTDAILVGRKTVEADDPELTCRLPGLADRSPVRVVLASRCTVPPTAKLFDLARPPVWIVCGDSSEGVAFYGRSGVRLLDIGASPTGRLNLRLAMMRLAAEGITRLLVEGGPSTARGFIDAGLADEVIIMQGAWTLAADSGMPPFGDRGLDLVAASPAFTLFEKRKAGEDTISVYRSNAHWQN